MRWVVVWVDCRAYRGAIAESFRGRLLGLHAARDADVVLIPGRSVHGFGLRRTVEVVALAADGGVLRSGRLRPFGVFFAPRADLIAEFPHGLTGMSLDRVGRVAFSPKGVDCARNPVSVRHPYRQSR